MEVQTVNVIEYSDDTILAVHSFSEDEAGNKEAEELFSRCAKENGAEQKDLEDFAIEDGLYETGGYQVFLAHSSN